MNPSTSRRNFIKAGGAALAITSLPRVVTAAETPTERKPPETYVKLLYDSFNDEQRKTICYDWDHKDERRGLLRTFVANNWHINSHTIGSDFYTSDQQELIRAIFEGLYHPDWIPSIEKQLKSDAGGYGRHQNIAIFGHPGEDKFEFVMTGRHLTIRCDGNTAEHVAFGGPIFYGHAADGFNEGPTHPGNVYWPQALEANKVYQMLDGSQQQKALLPRQPREQAVAFQGPEGKFPGLSVGEMSADQKEQMQKVLAKLLEPFRKIDRQEVRECLDAQGGLDACSLAFYSSNDIGDDGVWDNWRLEGPSFVWYFRGAPHVHVWVNVADSPKVELNA